MASSPTLDDAYDSLEEQLRRLLHFERIELATVDMKHATLTLRYVSGIKVAKVREGATLPLAGTIVGEAAGSRSSLIVQDRSADELKSAYPSWRPAVRAGLRSFMVAPLVSNEEVVGALSLGSTRPNAYTERDLALADRVGFHLAIAFGYILLHGGQRPDSNEVATLAEISRTITSSLDINEVYELVAEQVGKLVPFDKMAIWTVDLQRENLVASYVWGVDVPDLERGKVFPLKSQAAQDMLAERSGLNVGKGDVLALPGRLQDLLRGSTAGMPSIILVPLVSGNEAVGMLSLRSMAPNAYSDRDVAAAERIGAQIAGAVANARVYLECKQVEEAVREVVERLDLAVRGSGDGLWDWDLGQNRIWRSPRFNEMVGLNEQQESDGSPRWEEMVHPDDRDRVTRALHDHLERRLPYDVQYRMHTSTGEYRWLSDRGQAIWDDAGTAIRMSGSVRDITDDKLGGARGDTDIIDLSQPLATIESFRQTLLEGRGAEQDADVDLIATHLTSANRHMSKLVEDLQTLSWAMDSELRRAPVDLSAIVRSIGRTLRKAHPERKVTLSIAKGLMAEGDTRLLRVLVENLLDNAWKYTRTHQDARIEFGVTERDGHDLYYLRDDGIGFDATLAERIFGLFQRLHSEVEYEGTGVGLAIVRHIIRRHGGSIWADGEPERGATFYFAL